MKKRDVWQYDMLTRVGNFGAAHRDVFPHASVVGKLFSSVADAAGQLQHFFASEVSGTKAEDEGTDLKRKTRAALRRQLSAIGQVARAAFDDETVAAKFIVAVSVGDEKLLSQARAVAEHAKPFAKTFVANEMPAAFLRDLQQAIDALQNAIHQRADGRGQRKAAQANIDAAMRDGMKAARRLSALVPRKLSDPALRALWDTARRVDSRIPVPDQAAAPVAPGTPAVQAVAPTPVMPDPLGQSRTA